ncbi:MAG: hypothetical protein WCW17_01900 [Patescibacteria group bacterium]
MTSNEAEPTATCLQTGRADGLSGQLRYYMMLAPPTNTILSLFNPNGYNKKLSYLTTRLLSYMILALIK